LAAAAWRSVCLDEVLALTDGLNGIPAPTDGEGDLLRRIERELAGTGLPVRTVGSSAWTAVPSLWVGDDGATTVLVVHGDRINEDGAALAKAGSGVLRGKCDNTPSLAVAVAAMRRAALCGRRPAVALLVTTAEESRPAPKADGPSVDEQGRPLHGGRGFIGFLEVRRSTLGSRFVEWLRGRRFLCIDVRPLDKGDTKHPDGRPVELGEGLVVRLREEISDLDADETMVRHLRDLAAAGGVEVVDFRGGGRTEVGRAWHSLLKGAGVRRDVYRAGWLQMPIRDYHTPGERMHEDDVRRLQWMVEGLVAAPVP